MGDGNYFVVLIYKYILTTVLSRFLEVYQSTLARGAQELIYEIAENY